ncbi:hypothetical protein [Pseudorhodoplanes sp.]|uniref:hypothetical protein n=1 Tax=Pseudorhodoplanes sp. TaxID=1934341 RepID=UPI002B7E028B|nr:hypothetical protein [Pseudorhodoplanes sp.]HWV44071.1 hypothetical protein [Pseudorhodoplanes sp.]
MYADARFEQNTETKPDPFKLETLIAWLEKQPADTPYNYECKEHCLLAQYFCALGYRVQSMGPFSFWTDTGNFGLPDGFNDVAVGGEDYVSGSNPIEFYWTFGAALERARKLSRAE